MTNQGAGQGRLASGIRTKPRVELVVGIDFGTSSTKIAYRELGAVTRRVVPLLFKHGLLTYPSYCMPSVGHIDARGRLAWGAEAVRALESESWSSGIRRLKVLVAGEVDPSFRDERGEKAYRKYITQVGADPDVMRPSHIAAVALAIQMREVRTVLTKEYQGTELDLRFNICIPIDHMQHGLMLETYNKIHHVAERLYHEWPEDIWAETELLDVAASYFTTADSEERRDGRVFGMPEAMAQVTSYLTSLEVTKGIHAVLDLGAGTSDLSIFNLDGPNTRDRRCYWYAARNIARGTAPIEAAVARLLISKKPGTVTEHDLHQAITSSTQGSVIGKAIGIELQVTKKKFHHTWAKARYEHLRRQFVWEKVPIFLCGGGASLPGVADIFKKSWVPNWKDFSPRRLPLPDDFDGHNGHAPFPRLSVAYGLTYLLPELGEFTLPEDSPDHTPVIRLRGFPSPLSDGEPG